MSSKKSNKNSKKAAVSSPGGFDDGMDFVVPDTTRSRPVRRRGEGGARRPTAAAGSRRPASPATAAAPANDKANTRAPRRALTERKEFKRLLVKGKDRGFLSFDEINEGLPTDVTTVPQVEDALALLSEAEVEVVDDATKLAESSSGNREPRAALVESTETSEEMDYAEFSKGNDPVRMYLRKMGSVSLLTRDGEVEIAKRIEDGELQVIDAVLQTPICLSEILELGDRLKKGKIRVKEIVKENESGEDGQTLEFDEPKVTERALRIVSELQRLGKDLDGQE